MIEVENLTKFYGDLCAVDHINFRVNRGEILGLLGPNGAGKTTTMRILTCYLTPTEGNAAIEEFTISEHPQQIKNKIGYLPENAPLYPDMLVLDYLNYIADIRGLDHDTKRKRLEELSLTCGIRSVMHQPIGQLSRGFRQRVGLAQAMMSDPEILILDEPTSGLDPNQIVEIRQIIKQIGKEKTVILSTHILSEAEATCDRVLIINRGKIVADSDIGQLKQSMGKEQVVRLVLDDAPYSKVKKKMSEIPGITKVVRADSDNGKQLRIALYGEGDRDLRAQIYHAVKQEEWILLEMVRETRTLEHVFRELTKEN